MDDTWSTCIERAGRTLSPCTWSTMTDGTQYVHNTLSTYNATPHNVKTVTMDTATVPRGICYAAIQQRCTRARSCPHSKSGITQQHQHTRMAATPSRSPAATAATPCDSSRQVTTEHPELSQYLGAATENKLSAAQKQSKLHCAPTTMLHTNIYAAKSNPTSWAASSKLNTSQRIKPRQRHKHGVAQGLRSNQTPGAAHVHSAKVQSNPKDGKAVRALAAARWPAASTMHWMCYLPDVTAVSATLCNSEPFERACRHVGGACLLLTLAAVDRKVHLAPTPPQHRRLGAGP